MFAAVTLAHCGGDRKDGPGPSPIGSSNLSFTIGGASEFPGLNTDGRITLAVPAPAGGLVVLLSTNNPRAVTVPGAINVSPGATSAVVPVLTRKVAADTLVRVTASSEGTREASVLVPGGSFLSFASQVGDWVGQGHSQRATPVDHGFTVGVSHTLNTVSVTASSRTGAATWSLRMAAPPGEELRSGILYAGAVQPSSSATGPGLDFGGVGRSCSRVDGAFTILDIQYGPGPSVERLHAQFTQSCNGVAPLIGEVYAEQ